MFRNRSTGEVLVIIAALTLSIVIIIPVTVAGIKNYKTPKAPPQPRQLSLVEQASKACTDQGGVPIIGFDKDDDYGDGKHLEHCEYKTVDKKQ